jgi:transcription initiation factor TFIIE subunit alpha
MVARGFYEDVSLEEDQSKPNGSGSCGIVVVVLDALTRQQWVREEDLARSLMIPFNRLRQITHFLEQQKLVRRYYRKEAIHDASISTASPSHVSHDAHLVPTNVAGKLKMIMQPYCCLHYGQVYDVTLYRIHEMKKKLKDELDGNYMIQNYVCPNCERRYSSLNALDLVSHIDNNFHCKHCNEELSQDFGDLAWGGRGGDGDNARRDRHAKLKDFLQRMEVAPFFARNKHLIFCTSNVNDVMPKLFNL